jgi:transcriptional regulator with XRE-family HTH domain
MKTSRRTWFKDKLKVEMKKIGIDRREMADRLKLKRKTFYAYLEARAEPSILTLKKFCLIAGISVDEFLADIPDEEV